MRVSIVITNYNYGRYLGRAIQSAQSQKSMDGDVEIIVVDDASTDNSQRVIEAYSEGVKIIRHEINRGLPAAINTGIRASRGMYVMRLDSDDWLDRHASLIMSLFLDHYKEIGFVWPDYYVYDQYEQVTGRISEPQGAGVMIRKQLLVDVGLYDEEMLINEDKDILLRCLPQYPGYHLKMPLYRYYRHGANMTGHQERVQHYNNHLNNKHGEGAWDKGIAMNPGFLPGGRKQES